MNSRRGRSPSPDRRRFDRRDRSRSRSRDDSRSREAHSKDSNRYDRNRDRDDTSSRGVSVRQAPQSKAAIEAAKLARVAMVKRLTQGDVDHESIENKKISDKLNIDNIVDDELDTEYNSAEMMRIMGFAGFDTTKEKAVDDNWEGASAGAVSKHKSRKYRQYMNRKGGFNRPLQKMP